MIQSSSVPDLQKKIVEFFERYPNEQFKSRELARRLGIRAEKEYLVFKQALRELQDSGRIRRARGKQFGHLPVPEHLTGTLRLLRDGTGLVLAEDGSTEILIAPMLLSGASHGDTVKVSLFAQSTKQKEKGSRRDGEIVEVVARGRQIVVGTVERVRRFFIVIPDDKHLSREITVAEEDLNGATDGDKVVVEITAWGRRHLNPEGCVREVLGRAGEMTAEVRAVAREYKLPEAFPSEVVHEADAFPPEIPDAEIARRLDFRQRVCVTIDPEDAKDFDDAVSLEPLDDGTIVLGVHIADVSYFVMDGTALDKEALKRGTSVYFPNGVIPMLPERLSNDLCSLRPDRDRLAFSVLMTVTPRGLVKGYEIRESVIRSKQRFTYEEVQAIVEGASMPAGGAPVPEDLRSLVKAMHKLSQTFTKQRMREGSIDFDTAEAKFRFDDQGKPVEVIKKVRLDSHRLVEEFMLLANRMVAQHIGLVREKDDTKPFLYRVHDVPDPERVRELGLFVAKFGFKLNVEGGVSSKSLQQLLESVHGSEVENVINEVALRTMAKAVYSERNIGHYGLAFSFYSHFTSPIRRYPDLVVHRMLKRYAAGMPVKEMNDWRLRLPAIARQSSDMERLAMEAERAAVKVVQVEYMKRHIGDEFAAVVSGVVRFGIFVELTDTLVQGMVHVRDLDDDYYVYEEKRYALVGRHNGRQYRLGDPVHVKVLRVNPEERQIDFAMVVKEPKQRRKDGT
jgi:ribonuclease R